MNQIYKFNEYENAYFEDIKGHLTKDIDTLISLDFREELFDNYLHFFKIF